ncbi:MAG: hypothetical protein A2X82_19550 [Geobacteraceae bacterium GWC2_55_20]|nr:MAG: hypothetical protein A2X82_19550 [Geobacteraceae bacterium GWC2_55_20]OGU23111.1 MAG: hypothetical protein A2X85_10800 [Geobacteraceae bacterium GWF2_54_21]HCE66032.1 hypothetical protein [Geobacter sp.]
MSVVGGIDKLYISFSASLPLDTLIERLFIRLSLKQFERHDGGGNYYRMRHSLKAGGQTLVNVYSQPRNSDRKLYRNDRNLVAINGLALSDSALNGLRPHPNYPNDSALDLQHLCNAIIDLGGHVTQLDCYLDDIGCNHLDIEHLIHDLSRPRSYKLNIRSNLIKDINGRSNPPRPVGTGCYYGVKNFTQALLYRKDSSPHQGIFTKDNPLKYQHIRFEMRFRKLQARKIGQEIIEGIAYLGCSFAEKQPVSVTQVTAAVITKYFNFIKRTGTNKHRAALEPSWKAFIDAGLAANADIARV